MSAAPTVTVAAALAAAPGVERGAAETLLAALLGVGRESVYAFPERRLPRAVAQRYTRLCRCLTGGMPLAYLLGRRAFWTLELEVNRHTLVPRPETEHLVEAALARIPMRRPARVAELGTGAGGVAVAVADARPRSRVTATDRCARALRVARRNAAGAGLANVHFRRGDWCRALGAARFDVILSNPPYVETRCYRQSRALRHEPRRALCGGPDGLDAIRHLTRACVRHLRPGGWLLLEHGAEQGGRVRALLRRRGYRGVYTLPDLAGRERVSGARRRG